MNDVKIKVINSDKLINAINEGSYDVNLSSIMALGAVMLDTKKQEIYEYCHEDFDKCVKPIAIETLPSVQPKQQWIPVTERLPEDEQVVVVQYNDEDYDILKFPTAYRRCDIVAWMPLPKPYKGDEQNEQID